MDLRKFFGVAVLAGLLACRGGEKVEEDVVSLTPVVSSSIEDVFSDVEIVPLLFEGETYPSVVQQVQVSDEYIFVSDNKRLIHVFDKDGHYISCSSWARGAGPGEYDMMMGFSWNPFTQAIELLTTEKLLRYDVKFNFRGELALPTKVGENNLLFDQIYALSKDMNLLLPTGTSENPYCVYVLNSKAGEIVDKIDYSADVLVPITMQEQSLFSVGDDKVDFIAPAVTGKVFAWSDYRLINDLTFSYGSDFISKSDISRYEGNDAEFGRYLMECDKDIPVRVMMTKERAITYVKHGQTLRDFYAIVTDLKGEDNHKVNLYDGSERQFPFANYADENGVYVIYDKESLMESPKLLLDKATNMDSIFANIDDEDLILLKYKF